jgi:hypothetical protein
MGKQHFLFSALGIEQQTESSRSFRVIRAGDRHLQLRERLRQVAGKCTLGSGNPFQRSA